MGFRFQKRLSILPGVRINLSKGGVSTSVGPRGADVNIGRNGVTTNAGIPGTGLSYRSKLGGHGGKIGVLTLVVGLGVWAFQHFGKIEKTVAPVTSHITQIPATQTGQVAPAPSSDIRYVHREGSVLRETESTSGKSLKKEPKGAQVTLLQSDGDWAKVQDGALTGWMRMSVLGSAPPD
ncbi:MAG TPA: DUF4236 domain-containing protein [Rhizomicrobium sp.]|jgi:hypothetical protein|nr:DUF4236 domain-containing protein [Rhizomicrobium sp.]